MKNIYLLAFVFISNLAYSDKLDSLTTLAEKSNLARDWNNVAKYYYENLSTDTVQIRSNSEKAYFCAIKEENLVEKGIALSLMTELSFEANDYENYLENYKEVLSCYEQANRKDLQIEALNSIAYYYNLTGKYDEALHSLTQASLISKSFYGNEDKIAPLYINMGFSYLYKGMLDSSIVYNERALKIATQVKDTIVLIECNNQLGILQLRKNNFSEALRFYLSSLELYDKTNNKNRMMSVWCNIATLYLDWKKNDKALEFAQKAVSSAREFNAPKEITGNAMNILGIALGRNKKYDDAIDTLRNAEELIKENPYFLNSNYLYLSYFFNQLGKLDSCKHYLDKTEALLDANTNISKVLYYYNKGGYLFSIDKYVEAISYLQKYEDIASGTVRFEPDVYNLLSIAYEKSGLSIQQALDYKKKAYLLKDSIYKYEANEKLNEYYVRYNTAEKELQIIQLKTEQQKKQLRNTLIISILLFGLALVLIAFLYNRIKRLRKERELEITYKKIEQKENEYQSLLNGQEIRQMRSYLDGLESERNRLAKELHDDVSNALVVIKRNLEIDYSKDKMIQSISLLHKNIRNISHGLFLPIFKNLTLADIILDYFHQLPKDDKMKYIISITPDTGWDVIPQDVAVEIYRIFQESLGNAIKHAKAKTIQFEMNLNVNDFEMKIIDDGVGFNIDGQYKGVGLRVLNERAKILNANMQIDSVRNIGTKVILKMNIFREA